MLTVLLGWDLNAFVGSCNPLPAVSDVGSVGYFIYYRIVNPKHEAMVSPTHELHWRLHVSNCPEAYTRDT